MKTHTVAIIAFVAAALALAAYLTTSRSGPAAPAATDASGPALPTLVARINDAAEVAVRRPSGSFTFRRTSEGWGLAEKADYPVNIENVRAMIIALADLKLVEAKTANPALYARIGVQDVAAGAGADEAAAESQHVQIDVRDSAGAALGSVILGTQKWGSTPEVFMRRAGEAQSWLARGRVDVPSDQMAWVDKAAVNIPRDRVRRATITHPAGESITVSRGSRQMPSLMVESIPDGRELTTPGAGDQIGNLLSYLSFDDVAPATTIDLAAGEPGSRAVVHLFDGLLVTVSTAKVNDATWARIEAAYEPPPQAEPPADPEPDADSAAAEVARLEAESLNKRLLPWVFKLQDHKLRVLQTTWDSLLKPLAPAAETPATDAPAPTVAPNSTESDED